MLLMSERMDMGCVLDMLFRGRCERGGPLGQRTWWTSVWLAGSDGVEWYRTSSMRVQYAMVLRLRSVEFAIDEDIGDVAWQEQRIDEGSGSGV